MGAGDKSLKLCDCNRTYSIDAAALAKALGDAAPVVVHHELCRRESGALAEACAAGEVVVGCTQEHARFAEIAADAGAGEAPQGLNLREFAGWSAAPATAKMAALIAAARLPAVEPVPAVSLKSEGKLLIVGEAGAALGWAERLAEQLAVSVLISEVAGDAELPIEARYPVFSGRPRALSGHLGAFAVDWVQANPIDLELCTRCNACVRACPEGAIGFAYQVDLERCASHRACVAACGAIGAIDFARRAVPRQESFDLVLDLSPEPLLKCVELPQGYLAPGRDPLDQALAAQALLGLVGEFEKPRYVAFRDKLCAHSRAGQPGCNNCLEVCSTQAISANGDTIRVDTQLCQGCGTCATVCPSGALSYQYPRVADLGLRIKTMLAAYHAAGGADACLLFHSTLAGRALLEHLGRRAAAGRSRGLPARVIPVETYSADAVGLDLLLGAIAFGASQVAILTAGSHDSAPLKQQAAYGQTILAALGYAGEHFRLLDAEAPEAISAALGDWPPARGPGQVAAFNLFADKRTSLDFVIDHLARHAPTPQTEIALPAGAPFGSIAVSDACTLCMACVGACPAGALKSAPDLPRLSFLEKRCVQCGICEASCPEAAISLTPRLLLDKTRHDRVLREGEVFRCTRCGKPMGARPLIDAMLAKLAGHSMFATEAERARLTMCGDCRVIDLMQSEKATQAWEMRE